MQCSFKYRFTYDVFLSFRGEDTRYGFSGNLYKALCDKGIHTFMDDQQLPRGDQITSALEKAIEESRIFLIVLSENYAFSSFCLDELVFILKFSKQKGLLVLPLFHMVDPSDVRHHRGSFGKAFENHENKIVVDKEKLDTWKIALHQVANLSGYHLKHGEGYEYEFIQRIVELVSSKINRAPAYVSDYPVGLESQVQKVNLLLDVGSDDVVHMVGIYGIGGVGKTTLAVAIYNSIADHFEALCFLENVRETSNKHGLQHLQTNLLSETIGDIKFSSVRQGISIIQHRLQQKKVLLILDDVDKQEQLEALVGRPHWFGLGSRVIITTRDKQLLACHGVKRTYEVNELNERDALELLSWKAFKLGNVDSCYKDVLNQALTYASGLPLALEVIGSNLFGKKIEQWKSTLDQYKRIPNKKIQEILKLSYDALEEEQQSVFLDIACCFKNQILVEVEDILCAHHGHCVKQHIEVLVEKSLIKINLDSDHVTLHDLIDDMGKEIVRKESPKEPGKRSRLWLPDDIVQVLEENEGTDHIEIICMDFPLFEEVEIEWDGDAFKKMKKLKTLVIRNGNFSVGPNYLPNTLRVLEWRRYPAQNLPYDFHPKKLDICKLPNSGLTSPELAVFLKKKFVNMTSLKFDNSECLTQIPDVSCVPYLEILSFRWCKNLLAIHNSVGFLKKLKILDAEGCTRLKSLPPLELTSLEQLELAYCCRLKSLPEILGKMENITELDLDQTPIEKFHPSFQNLTGLKTLHLAFSFARAKTDVWSLLSCICTRPELVKLECWRLERLLAPNDEYGAENLSFIMSSNVQRLHLRNCNLSDNFFPLFLPWFANVNNLDLSQNNFTVIPECIKECHFLTRLTLDNCERLQEIRGIPPNLKYFSAKECISLTSSCRNMLLNQELHEDGSTFFYLPAAEIPELFEFQTSELQISFWFRNKFPAISICLFTGLKSEYSGNVKSIISQNWITINGNKHLFENFWVGCDCTCLFDLREKMVKNNLDESLLENEWNHAEVVISVNHSRVQTFWKTGLHVLKQEIIMEDVLFTDPCTKNNRF